jgi:hypothetical protein
MTEKLTDALYEEALARVADGNIDLGGTIGLRRWCDGSGPCAVETEPHGHWRGGVSVSTREVVLRLVRERDEARTKLRVTTTEYKPGWVQGLEAVARSAGYDPDKARHEGVEPPDFIQDVIDALRAEVAQLKRDAAVRSFFDTPLCEEKP